MAKTLILVSGKTETLAGINYQQSHPSAKGILVSKDIPAEIYLRQNHIPHQALYQLQPSERRYSQARRLPYKIIDRFLNRSQVKQAFIVNSTDYTQAFKEMLRYRTQVALTDFFTLSQACRKIKCTQLVIGSSFSKDTIKTVSRELGISVKWLETPNSFKLTFTRKFAKIKNIIAEIAKIILLLCQHPIIALKFINLRINLIKSPELIKNGVLVFSNGLNLASYHSVFTHLNRMVPVNIITDKQSFRDSFYLAKYNLNTTSLTAFQLKTPPTRLAIYRQLKTQIHQLLTQSKLFSPKTPSWVKAETLQQIIKASLWMLTQQWLPGFLQKQTVAQRLIETITPRLLITTHDPGPSAMAFVIPAQRRQISTLVLTHGTPSEEHFFFSDTEVIWGPLTKKYLLQLGIKTSKLISIGQPLFHDYKTFFQKYPPLSISNKVKIGVLVSGYGHNESDQVEYFLKLFPQLAKLKQSVCLNIRTHSAQSIDGLHHLAKTYNLKLNLYQPELLEEFIASNQIIITQTSTAALAALIAKKPTFYLPAFHHLRNQSSLANQPGFPLILTYSQVPGVIHQFLTHPEFTRQQLKKQQKFVNKYCGKIDRHVGSRIAKTIISKHLIQ